MHSIPKCCCSPAFSFFSCSRWSVHNPSWILGKRYSSSLPEPVSLSPGLATLLRDQTRALGVLVLRQAMPPDSHLSNNATFLWHRDQNRDKNHRMKIELEDPGPKFFGHIHAENVVCNRLLVPG